MRTIEEIKDYVADLGFEFAYKVLSIVKGIPLDRLQEICNAERDGRLVVLPCKVGDTVYLVLPKCRASRIPLAECSFFECDDCPRNKREIFEQKATTEMLSIMLFEKYNTLYVFGKTVFLTREEAEKALKGGAK